MVELNEKAVEAAATALDPEIWAMDGPGLTRSEVQIFHQRRQDSAVAASATVRAYLAALPAPDDGLEVVARLAGINGVILQRHIDDFREQYRDELNAAPGLVCLSAAQAALQSKDEQIERLTRERDDAQERATSNGMSWANALNEFDEAEQQVQKLTAEKAKLHKTGQEYLVASEAVFDWMNGNDLSADHEEQCPQDFARVCKAIVEFRSALETEGRGE